MASKVKITESKRKKQTNLKRSHGSAEKTEDPTLLPTKASKINCVEKNLLARGERCTCPWTEIFIWLWRKEVTSGGQIPIVGDRGGWKSRQSHVTETAPSHLLITFLAFSAKPFACCSRSRRSRRLFRS